MALLAPGEERQHQTFRFIQGTRERVPARGWHVIGDHGWGAAPPQWDLKQWAYHQQIPDRPPWSEGIVRMRAVQRPLVGSFLLRTS